MATVSQRERSEKALTLDDALKELYTKWGLGEEKAEELARWLKDWKERGQLFYIKAENEEGRKKLETLQKVLYDYGYTTIVFTMNGVHYLMPFTIPSLERVGSVEEEERGEEKEELRPPVEEMRKKLGGEVVRRFVLPRDSVDEVLKEFFPYDPREPFMEGYATIAEGRKVPSSLKEQKLTVATSPDILSQFSWVEARLSLQLKHCWSNVCRGTSYAKARAYFSQLENDYDRWVLYNLDVYGYYLNVGKKSYMDAFVETYYYFLDERNYDAYLSHFPPTWRGMIEKTAAKLAEEHTNALIESGKVKEKYRDVVQEALEKRYRAGLLTLMVMESTSSKEAFLTYYTREWAGLSSGADEETVAPLSQLQRWYGSNPTVFTVEIEQEGDRALLRRKAYILREDGIEVYEERDGQLKRVGKVDRVDAVLSDGSSFTLEMVEGGYRMTPSPFVFIGGAEVTGDAITGATHINKVSYQWKNIQYNLEGAKDNYLFTPYSDIGLFQMTLRYGPFGEIPEYPSGGFVPPTMVKEVKEDIDLWGQKRVVEQGKPFPEARLYIVNGPANFSAGEELMGRVEKAYGVVVGKGERYLHVVGDERLSKDEKGYYLQRGEEKLYLAEDTTHIFALQKAGEEGRDKSVVYNAYIALDEQGRVVDSTVLEGIDNLADASAKDFVTVKKDGKEMKVKVLHVGTLVVGMDTHRDYARGNDGVSLLVAENFDKENLLSSYLSTPLPVEFDSEEDLPYVPFRPIGTATLYNEEDWDYQAWGVVHYRGDEGTIVDYGEAEWVVLKGKEEKPEEPEQEEQPEEPEEKPLVLPRLQRVLEDAPVVAEVEKSVLALPPKEAERARKANLPYHFFVVTEKVGDVEYVLNKRGERVGIVVEGEDGPVYYFLMDGKGNFASLSNIQDQVSAYGSEKEAYEELLVKGKVKGYTVASYRFKGLTYFQVEENSSLQDVVYWEDAIVVKEDRVVLPTGLIAKGARTYTFHLYGLEKIYEKNGGYSADYKEVAAVNVRAVKEATSLEGVAGLPSQGMSAKGILYTERFERGGVEVNPEIAGEIAFAKLAHDAGNPGEAVKHLEKAFKGVAYRCESCGKSISLYDLAVAYYNKCPGGSCDFDAALEGVASELGISVDEAKEAVGKLLLQASWRDTYDKGAVGAVLYTLGSTLVGKDAGNVDRILDAYNTYNTRVALNGLKSIIEGLGNVEIVMPAFMFRVVMPEYMFFVREEGDENSYLGISLGSYLEMAYSLYKEGLMAVEIGEDGTMRFVATEKAIRQYGGAAGLTGQVVKKGKNWSGWVKMKLSIGYTGVEAEEEVEVEGGGLHFGGGVEGGVSYIIGMGKYNLVFSLEGSISWDAIPTVVVERTTDEEGKPLLIVRESSPGRTIINPSVGIVFPHRKYTVGGTYEEFGDKKWVGVQGAYVMEKSGNTLTIQLGIKKELGGSGMPLNVSVIWKGENGTYFGLSGGYLMNYFLNGEPRSSTNFSLRFGSRRVR